MIHVAVVNHATSVRPERVAQLVSALNVQIGHLSQAGYPVWAQCQVYRDRPPASAWQLVLLDDTDQADALGYHTTTDLGMPLGRVFVRTVHDAGLEWTVTASHELVEMLVDPWAVLGVDLGNGTWVAWEACDPVEADAYGYRIGDVLVSDFITPAWFTAGAPGPYDWTRKCPSPLTLLPGGYVAVQRSGEWGQVVARMASPDGVSRVEFAQRIQRRRRPYAVGLAR